MKTFINDKKLFKRRIFLIILDIMLINIAVFSALLSRFDFRLGEVPLHYTDAVLSYPLKN